MTNSNETVYHGMPTYALFSILSWSDIVASTGATQRERFDGSPGTYCSTDVMVAARYAYWCNMFPDGHYWRVCAEARAYKPGKSPLSKGKKRGKQKCFQPGCLVLKKLYFQRNPEIHATVDADNGDTWLANWIPHYEADPRLLGYSNELSMLGGKIIKRLPDGSGKGSTRNGSRPSTMANQSKAGILLYSAGQLRH